MIIDIKQIIYFDTKNNHLISNHDLINQILYVSVKLFIKYNGTKYFRKNVVYKTEVRQYYFKARGTRPFRNGFFLISFYILQFLLSIVSFRPLPFC